MYNKKKTLKSTLQDSYPGHQREIRKPPESCCPTVEQLPPPELTSLPAACAALLYSHSFYFCHRLCWEINNSDFLNFFPGLSWDASVT